MCPPGRHAGRPLLDRAHLRGEMIELRLHGVQPLTVQIEGARHFLQEVFEPVQALIDN